MLVSIARICTKPISDLSLKKNSFYFLWGFGRCNFFFEFWIYQSSISIDCLIFHRQRVCCAFSNVFSSKILNIFLETVDSSIVYQKNVKMSYLPMLLWVLSLKNKVFRAKFFRIRLIQRLGVSFGCSKLYKTHFWPLSEKTSRFNFCRVSEDETFFSSFEITNLEYQSIVLYFTGEESAALFKCFFNENSNIL